LDGAGVPESVRALQEEETAGRVIAKAFQRPPTETKAGRRVARLAKLGFTVQFRPIAEAA
jgi:hypothetical protein